MPRWAEKLAKKRGGVTRYRVIKRDGQTLRCMVTRKAGPKGGKTICYKISTKKKK